MAVFVNSYFLKPDDRVKLAKAIKRTTTATTTTMKRTEGSKAFKLADWMATMDYGLTGKKVIVGRVLDEPEAVPNSDTRKVAIVAIDEVTVDVDDERTTLKPGGMILISKAYTLVQSGIDWATDSSRVLYIY